jgi:7tm Odorant receptor
VAIWPGDNLINWPFLVFHVSTYLFILVPSLAYLITTRDKFSDIMNGGCETIQMLVYCSKMFEVIRNRHELKELLTKLVKSFEGKRKENRFILLHSSLTGACLLLTALDKDCEKVRVHRKKVLEKANTIVVLFLVLSFGALLFYFYTPMVIDLVKRLLGRDDLSYPLVLKANYLVFDPRKDDLTYAIYTIVSKLYINLFLAGFYLMDLFLLTVFFYSASLMETVKIKLQILSEAEDELSEAELTKRFIKVIKDHQTALGVVKSLDNVTRQFMLSQFVLFSISFCFVLFNLTQVIIQ